MGENYNNYNDYIYNPTSIGNHSILETLPGTFIKEKVNEELLHELVKKCLNEEGTPDNALINIVSDAISRKISQILDEDLEKLINKLALDKLLESNEKIKELTDELEQLKFKINLLEKSIASNELLHELLFARTNTVPTISTNSWKIVNTDKSNHLLSAPVDWLEPKIDSTEEDTRTNNFTDTNTLKTL